MNMSKYFITKLLENVVVIINVDEELLYLLITCFFLSVSLLKKETSW